MFSGRFSFCRTLLFVFATPAFAASWLAPSVSNATVNGLAKVTELRIVNRGADVAQVSLQVLTGAQTSPAPVNMAGHPPAALLLPGRLRRAFLPNETTSPPQNFPP